MTEETAKTAPNKPTGGAERGETECGGEEAVEEEEMNNPDIPGSFGLSSSLVTSAMMERTDVKSPDAPIPAKARPNCTGVNGQ
jgi:hypothetical protein